MHVPFCRRRCAYCDFSVAIREPDVGFVDDVVREFANRVEDGLVDARFRATSVFLGGGTPSYLGDDAIATLIELASPLADAEVTIEVNPEDLSVGRVERWRRAGVGRISVGLQSLDDRVLAHLGRGHGAQEARRRIRAVVEACADLRVSVDLIFGDPIEDDASWRRTIQGVVDLGVGHVSTYALTIEPRTRFRSLRVDDEAQARRYEITDEVLGRAGFEWYEISNWARPGQESRHNQTYWSGGAYLGLGPSAHTYRDPVRSWNVASWPRWRDRVRAGLVPTEGLEVLTANARVLEARYLALRQRGGIDAEVVPAWADEFFEEGASGRRRLTVRGRLVADEIVARWDEGEQGLHGPPVEA